VAHACNPSYSGGRDQEDCSSKTVRANSLRDPLEKNPSQQRAVGVAQGVGSDFKPQYHIHIKMVFLTEVTTLFKKERAVFLINRVGLTGYLHAKE
jgi:hypothetical protein